MAIKSQKTEKVLNAMFKRVEKIKEIEKNLKSYLDEIQNHKKYSQKFEDDFKSFLDVLDDKFSELSKNTEQAINGLSYLVESEKHEKEGYRRLLKDQFDLKTNEILESANKTIEIITEDKSHREKVRKELNEKLELTTLKYSDALKLLESELSQSIKSLSSQFEEGQKKFKLFNKENDSRSSKFEKLFKDFEKNYSSLEENYSNLRNIVATRAVGGHTSPLQVAGKAVSTRYGDVNFIAGTGMTISASDNDTIGAKRVDITIASTGSGLNFADAETPSGAINGSNQTFTLAHTVSPAASLRLYMNGVLQSPAGVDFTLSGVTITMVNAPLTGATLICWYRY